MVIVPQINGRLGNQLHQLCTAYGVAEDHGAMLALCGNFSYKHNYNLVVNEIRMNNMYKEVSLSNFSYKKPEIPKCDFIYLKGYNLSYKYHIKYRNELSSIFTPKKEIVEKCKWQKDNSGSGLTCGIHVRKGDYVGNGYYFQIPNSYYINCAKKIDNKVGSYIVFSDDIDWCKENLKLETNKTVHFSGNKNPVEDQYLLGLCDIKILSNSSFGFFAAYLYGDKEVYYPSEWMYHDGFKIEDYCLSEWEKVLV